jgi:hypothetical protein
VTRCHDEGGWILGQSLSREKFFFILFQHSCLPISRWRPLWKMVKQEGYLVPCPAPVPGSISEALLSPWPSKNYSSFLPKILLCLSCYELSCCCLQSRKP